MTAELFVKLTAKLYSETPASQIDFTHPISKSDETDESADSSDAGGAPLNPPDTNGDIDSHRPAIYHAHEMNRFAILETEGAGDEVIDLAEQEATSPLKQWIPKMNDPFWKTYTNKLRVNAIEGGVCDLS